MKITWGWPSSHRISLLLVKMLSEAVLKCWVHRGRKSFTGQTSSAVVYWKLLNRYFANSEDPGEMPAFEHETSGFTLAQNSLAKWKKLEANEINFIQSFSQKVVSTSCFVFNSLPARGDFCCLLITFANILDPDQAWQNVSLIWIQTVWHPDGIEKFSIQRVKYGTLIKWEGTGKSKS